VILKLQVLRVRLPGAVRVDALPGTGVAVATPLSNSRRTAERCDQIPSTSSGWDDSLDVVGVHPGRWHRRYRPDRLVRQRDPRRRRRRDLAHGASGRLGERPVLRRRPTQLHATRYRSTVHSPEAHPDRGRRHRRPHFGRDDHHHRSGADVHDGLAHSRGSTRSWASTSARMVRPPTTSNLSSGFRRVRCPSPVAAQRP
jgi:hypothetical protein